jgi:hypothetical protein
MSDVGQTRLSPATTVTSGAGKKPTFPNFVQKSIHRMSGIGREADKIFRPVDFRFVP